MEVAVGLTPVGFGQQGDLALDFLRSFTVA
jgi:hypothetical protein